MACSKGVTIQESSYCLEVYIQWVINGVLSVCVLDITDNVKSTVATSGDKWRKGVIDDYVLLLVYYC